MRGAFYELFVLPCVGLSCVPNLFFYCPLRIACEVAPIASARGIIDHTTVTAEEIDKTTGAAIIATPAATIPLK